MIPTETVVIQGNARALELDDESVDLIVTSPPYFAQRDYKDGGESAAEQIGSEPSPQEFLEALWACTAEWWRVLKLEGSCWVNLGDKRSGSGAPGTTSGLGAAPQGVRTGMAVTSGSEVGSTLQGTTQQRRAGAWARSEGRNVKAPRTKAYNQAAFGRPKSKMLLPHRYAIGCEDGAADPEGMGWIVRQDEVWQKLNGMPESVRDRTRDQHEYVFHLCKQGAYYQAIDELRQPHVKTWEAGNNGGHALDAARNDLDLHSSLSDAAMNPLGAAPGSVWALATEPLIVPDYLEVDHYAAFPTELPRRIILGWSPSGICLECGQGRRPLVEVELVEERPQPERRRSQDVSTDEGNGWNGEGYPKATQRAHIVGTVCSCGENPSAPTRPAVVLDPFGGTGTTAMVARALGRIGVTVDISADYCRLARWRIWESGHGAKVVARTNGERQGTLL